MNKKYGVLLTALFTVGSTVYADDNKPDEDNLEGYAKYLEKTKPAIPAGVSSAAHVLDAPIDYDNDKPIYINTVLGFKTTGKSMADFRVTVVYADGETTDTEKWVAEKKKCLGGGKPDERGVADGGNWSLEVCDTWRKLWTLTVSEATPIKSIKIEPIIDEDGDGVAGVFDVITDKKEEHTLGSSNGQKISEVVHIDHNPGLITATYSRPVYLLGGPLPNQQDLYAVLTLVFDEPLSGTLMFSADTDNVELPKGCCCLDFDLGEDFGGYSGEYPLYLNKDGNNTHILPEDVEPEKGEITNYLVCYDRKYPTQLDCESALGTSRNMPFPFPEGQNTEVDSTHWFVNKDKFDDLWCPELKKKPELLLPFDVALLATGVDLKATQIGNGKVKLKLTTDSEKDTAKLEILRGNELENEGTEINTVCSFPTGSSPYTCIDNVVGDNYRVLETEYSGRLIVYKPVDVN
jgi:hypothetical protein